MFLSSEPRAESEKVNLCKLMMVKGGEIGAERAKSTLVSSSLGLPPSFFAASRRSRNMIYWIQKEKQETARSLMQSGIKNVLSIINFLPSNHNIIHISTSFSTSLLL